VKAEGIRRGADHVRQLSILGDGAPWIWNIATAKFPEATQIVDLFHAREHVHDLARRLEFMLGDRKEEWLAARLEDLDDGDGDGDGDVDGICRAAASIPWKARRKKRSTPPWATSRTTPPASATNRAESCRPAVSHGSAAGGRPQDAPRVRGVEGALEDPGGVDGAVVAG
jgi:transposase